MDCSGCQTNCCNTKHLHISEEDLHRFKTKMPNLKYLQYGPFIVLNQSCPFFEHGRCSDYEHRPIVCQLHPFDFRGRLYNCKAADTITPEDKYFALALIHTETRKMMAMGTKYHKEFTKFTKKLAELNCIASSDH